MDPHGLALLAYHEGDTDATLTLVRDDGVEHAIPASHFFRGPDDFSAIERAALERCRGRVLDVGAGTGLHALALADRGLEVTAIDVSEHAVDVMRRRGVQDVRRADAFAFHEGRYDTLLMLGHGIGMVGTLDGLGRFLGHVPSLMADGAQLLCDSLDVLRTDDAANLAYHEANRRAGRYVGEVRLRFAFGETRGPRLGWLHVDAATLGRYAEAAGLGCEIVLERESGEYLARLVV
ncbi:MAG: methyltransferase domain-containing protein [Gemmatimonadales bacterium]|jgi:SAM-dependent methyltransferase